jgi:hypothetical protein
LVGSSLAGSALVMRMLKATTALRVHLGQLNLRLSIQFENW